MINEILKCPTKYIEENDGQVVLGNFGKDGKTTLTLSVDSDGYMYILSQNADGDTCNYPQYDQSIESVFEDVINDLNVA